MPEIRFQKDKELSMIEALKQGKQEVLGLLYDTYAPVMLGVISRIVQNDKIAEEVLQETFVAIWSRIGVYKASSGRFLIWGLAIARGIALEAVKTGKYNYLSRNGQKSALINKDKVKEGVQQDLLLQNGRVCSLEPQEKAILEAIYIRGQSCSQTATELSITEEELKYCLKKAFIHLRADK